MDRTREGAGAGQASLPGARPIPSRFLSGLASIELTIACLVALSALVALCTLAQAKLGTHAAVEKYIRTLFVAWGGVPVFPGGGLVGGVLLANLAAAFVRRLEWTRRKAGLWLTHFGLALLFVGEFATAFLAVESRLAIQEGQTLSASESDRAYELAVVDASSQGFDQLYQVPESRLKPGRTVRDPRWPFELKVLRVERNATLRTLEPGEKAVATAGAGLAAKASALPPVASDDERDAPAAYVEILEGGRSLGTWLVWTGLGGSQPFQAGGRDWRLELRNRRYHLPFLLTLQDFRHEKYPGTEIPKSFSSLVRLKDDEAGEDRDVLISMNKPLRHRGRTFYQASFSQDETVSVLQVVENPGWTVPYVACILVGLGLLVHFTDRLWAARGAVSAASASTQSPVQGAARRQA